jgi:hypothetical protein
MAEIVASVLGYAQATPIRSAIVELAWRAQSRLHYPYRHLGSRVGPHKALTAVAYELAVYVRAVSRVLDKMGSGRCMTWWSAVPVVVGRREHILAALSCGPDPCA